MKQFFLPILIFLISSCHAQTATLKTNEDANTLLWEISGNKLQAPSYLFGTFHMLCKEDINFSGPLKQAVARVHSVFLEMDLDDPSTLAGATTLMKMSGNKKLTDLYTQDEYKRVYDYFKDSLRMPLILFHSMKPNFLVAMLYPKMMPCKTMSGVEEELMKLAKEDKKEINGLETMAFQASLFDSIPYEKQAAELLRSIDSMQVSRIYFDSMLNAYKTQRLDEIEMMFSKNEFGEAEDNDVLLDKRNKKWVAQLKTIMKKDPVFIAVGAGHLVGKKGLISLLRKEGYTLRPIMNR